MVRGSVLRLRAFSEQTSKAIRVKLEPSETKDIGRSFPAQALPAQALPAQALPAKIATKKTLKRKPVNIHI